MQLGVVSSLRGTHSTGLLQGNIRERYMNYRVVKDCINCLDFEEMYEDTKTGILSRLTDNLYMMHVRAATKGVINKENAHPYDFEDFIVAHNGTLKDAKYDDKEKTDTFLFFKDFQQKLNDDPEKDFDEVLADHINSLESGGAYAITLFNKINRCMYFLRNSARPLWLAVHKKRGVIYWASERWMLSAILGRHGLKTGLEDESKDDYKIFNFEEHQVHRLDLDDIKKGEENLFIKTDIIARRPPPVITEVYEDELPWGMGWCSSQAYPKIEDKREKKENKVSVPLVRIKDGKRLAPVFETNCITCQKKMNLVDMHEGMCIDDDNYIYQCEDCTEHDIGKQVHIN